MKRILNKILSIILLFFILTNFLLTNYGSVYADDGYDFGDLINDILGTVVGIFTYIPKVTAVGVAYGADMLLRSLAYSEGTVKDDGSISSSGSTGGMITPFDIFFNKMAITDINFFNFSGGENSVIYQIRSNIAKWYYIVRNIAAIILLVVLIYIGIRMAISTVAQEKALYKKMLYDWACSLALIFLIQYIAIFAINANNALINLIRSTANSDSVSNIQAVVNEICTTALKGVTADSLAAAVVYCMFVAQTFALVIAYFSRMIKLAFLLIISPLITLTYSIDKIGDGKAQALGAWLKEFVYSILIQPFHCIIYLAFIETSLALVSNGNNMVAGVLAILCLKFTKDAEKLVRQIFGFKDDEKTGASIATGMAVSAMALGKAKDLGKGTRKAVNAMGSYGHAAKDSLRGMHASAMAIGAAREAKKNGESNDGGEEMSFSDRKAQALEELEAKEQARKLERQNRHRYAVPKNSKKEIKEEADKIMAASKATGENITEGQAMARARLNLAQKNRDDAKKGNYNSAHSGKLITGYRNVVSAYEKTRQAVRKSSVANFVKENVKAGVAGGLGLFTGAAMYGSGSNLSSSVTAGLTAKRGVGEFLKTSKRSLANDIDVRKEALGIREGDADRMNQIMADGEAGEYDTEKMVKEIFKQLESSLKGLDADAKKDIKYKIRNSINHDALTSPDKSPSAMAATAIQSAIGSSDEYKDWYRGLSATDKQAFNSTVTNFATKSQEAAIYNTVQTGVELGLDPNALLGYSEKIYYTNENSVEDDSDEPENDESDSGEAGPFNPRENPIEEGNEEDEENGEGDAFPTEDNAENPENDDNDELGDLNGLLEEQKAKIESLTAELKASNEEIEKLQARKNELEERLRNSIDVAETSRLEERISTLNQKITTQNEKIDRINAELGISDDKA